MRYSLVLPFFRNQSMLTIQLEEWEKHKACNLIIVDDCSGSFPARDVMKAEPGLSLYEITTPKKWNQHGARNLGALVCETPFALLTDMDHLLLADDAEKLAGEQPDFNSFYMFSRVTAPEMTPYKPHPNSFLVSREKYWEVGGYDEDFAGTYGGDGIFTRQLSQLCGSVLRHDIKLARYPREYVSDASTIDYDRQKDKKAYRELFDKKRAEDDLVPKNPIRFDWKHIL